MKNKIYQKSKMRFTTGKILLLAMLLPTLILSTSFSVKVKEANATNGGVSVTVLKYADGQMATAESTDSTRFPMSSTWSAENIGSGTGEYTLGAASTTPYKAKTTAMTEGANYSTHEILTRENVGATCDEAKPFSLLGYTTGDTIEEAVAGVPTLTIPTFTNLTTNKTVIVWNTKCTTTTPPTMAKVVVTKFIQNAKATMESADNSAFPMNATWVSENPTSGTSGYTLNSSGETPYATSTMYMNIGADYSTDEILTGELVGSSCEEGKHFALEGYTTGDTYEEAMGGERTTTAPVFTDLQHDKYVIVWNRDCTLTSVEGELIGEVLGSNGTLAVTSIEAIDTQATANGTFEDGWKYAFNVTVPTNEPNVAMKFSNWLRNGGGGSILVANNMRISSAQADNGNATVLLTDANTYSTPTLHMTGDLDGAMAGKQVRIIVEVSVPSTTLDGSYTTTYGIQTTE